MEPYFMWCMRRGSLNIVEAFQLDLESVVPILPILVEIRGLMIHLKMETDPASETLCFLVF
jgi:hypothetical protein